MSAPRSIVHQSRLPRVVRVLLLLLAPLAASSLVGCDGPAQYTVTGRVVDSQRAAAVFVLSTDARFDSGEGVPGARVEVIRIPDMPGRERAGETTSGADGRFSVGLGTPGPAMFREPYRIIVTLPGRRAVVYDGLMPNRSDGKSLLVLSGPVIRGDGTPEPTTPRPVPIDQIERD